MEINLEILKKIIYDAGKLFFNRTNAVKGIEKGIADYVTEVDITIENRLQQMLYEQYPHIQFMGEEKSNDDIDENGTFWVLDPVDGTTNLIHDYRCSSISLALICENKVVLGIVYNPYAQEMFWAEKGKGCYLNGHQVHVSGTKAMSESLLSIGTSPYYKELSKEIFERFHTIFLDCQDIRRSGSAAVDLAYVACGRIEAFFEKKLKLWDYAAGMLLIREAGGKVLDYQGNPTKLDYVADIVAGTPAIAEILTERYL